MPRPLSLPLFLVLAALAAPAVIATGLSEAGAAEGDVTGASDYPGIGRFAGSIITGYDAKDFDATRLQTAPFEDGKATGEQRPEGRVTRIAYRTGPGPSMLEVARNFESQIAGAGYETVFTCDTDGCGGIPFSEALDVLPIPLMWVDGFNYHYFVARKSGDNGAVTWATLLVSQNNDAVTAELVVTEVGAMENKMIDAAAMQKGLGEEGHIALYGIYFDTDKAVVKPESKPTLDEIAKLLASAPDLHVVVVGHTDSQGALDYNVDLSRRRAAAVAAALASGYGIAPERLATAGVGYLSPVGSNQTEAGRALNRRVELVQP